MPPRVRRSSLARARRPLRKLEWADFQTDDSVSVGNFVSYDVLSQFKGVTGASVTGVTIARIHCAFWVTSAVTEGDGISTSFIVDQVDETQAAPGVATSTAHVLSPTFSPNADWMLYRKWNAHPAYSMNGAVNNLEMDIKSKRRLHEIGDTLLFIVENIDATAAVTFAVHIRALLMMP